MKLLIFVFLIVPMQLFAADNVSDFDRSLKENEQYLRHLNKQQQELILKKEHKNLRQTEKKKTAPIPKKQCFAITKYQINGNAFLSQKKQDKLTKNYLGDCIYLDDINNLIRDLTNLYVAKGYIMARIYFVPEQNITTGIVKLKILEGEIEEIILNDNKRADRLKIFTAFPFKKGDILNVRSSDQGFDQLNRLTSNNTKISYIPGSKPGLVKVKIDTHSKNKFRSNIAIDNSGQKSTGERKKKLTLEQDNLLSLNDKWFYSYTKDDVPNENRLFNKSYSLNIDIPFGYYNFSFSSSRSKYLNTITQSNIDIPLTGLSKYYSYNLSRNIYRNSTSKISAKLALNIKDSESFKDGVKEVNSKKTTTMDFGLNYSTHIKKSIISMGLNYHRGTRFFGSYSDPIGINSSTPKAQFDKYNFTSDIYSSFNLLKHKLTYKFSLFSQFSPDHLYPAEQIFIGGQYSVRGFKSDSLSGDSGFYINNEIISTIPKLKINNKYFSSNRLQAFLGYDLGVVRMRGGKQVNFGRGKGYLSGIAYGIKYHGKRLRLDITQSQAIRTPAIMKKTKNELYFGINFKVI